MSHTKEPWKAIDRHGRLIESPSGDIVSIVDGCVDGKGCRERDVANAARIVACVNACAGIADPAAIPSAVVFLQVLANMDVRAYGRGIDVNASELVEQAGRIFSKLKGGKV